MMAYELLDTSYGGKLAFTRDYVLDGVSISLHLYWLAQVGEWAIQAMSSSGAPITPVGIVAPGGILPWDSRRNDAPDGVLGFIGARTGGPGALGGALLLAYVPSTASSPLGVVALLRGA